MSTIKVQDIQHTGNSNDAISLASDSSVALKHSGSSKLTTSSTGVSVTGTCTATEFSGSAASLTALPAANLTGTLPAIDGSNLTGISTDLVGDTSPQLGGDLDLQSNQITTSTTDGNIKATPNGDGVFEVRSSGSVDGTMQLNCTVNSHGIKLRSPAHSAGQSYTFIFPDNNITADKYLKVKSISGSGATAVGQLEYASLDANDLGEGTIPDARFPATLPAASAANLTSIPAANLTGTLPAISGANLTNLPSTGLSSDASFNTVGGTNAGDSFDFTFGGATENTLFGYNCGTDITTADDNVAFGYEALGKCTTGSSNSVLGKWSAENLTTGTHNTYIGNLAGALTTSGNFNSILGSGSGYRITTGEYNLILGRRAAYDSSTGITTGDNNIVIGSNAEASSATVSNEVTIGDSNITKFRIPGCDGFEIDDNGTIDLGGAINENVFAITDASSVALDPDNGMVQTWTLGANRTATDSLTTGQSMLLIVTASSSNYTLTWPTMKWNGGSAPTLGGANATAIELFKVGSQLYGATIGDLS